MYCDTPLSAEVPFVYTEHSSNYNRANLPEKSRNRLRLIAEQASAFLVVSRTLQQNLLNSSGVESIVVPNMYDSSVFYCRKYDEKNRFRFASAGNLVPLKDFPTLLRAFARLSEPAELVIFGAGPEMKNLLALRDELKLGDRVIFRGHCTREELAETYAVSDCFVLPSRSETFGVVYIEAMAAGLPVIATVCGGPEDFVTPETGLLIPTDDVNALADAMEQMMREHEKYDAAAIAEYARSHFSPEVMAERLTRIYEELLK